MYNDTKIIELLTQQVTTTIRVLKHIRAFHQVDIAAAELLDLKIIAAEQTLDNIKEDARLAELREGMRNAS